mgnify:CR=1 FL=1
MWSCILGRGGARDSIGILRITSHCGTNLCAQKQDAQNHEVVIISTRHSTAPVTITMKEYIRVAPQSVTIISYSYTTLWFRLANPGGGRPCLQTAPQSTRYTSMPNNNQGRREPFGFIFYGLANPGWRSSLPSQSSPAKHNDETHKKGTYFTYFTAAKKTIPFHAEQ